VPVLGLSAFYHDSAAALLVDGEIVSAAQEERFTRRRHDASYPVHAIASCLRSAGLSIDDIDAVAFYDKPFLKFERLLETHVAFAPHGFTSFGMGIPVWVRDKLFLKQALARELASGSSRNDWADRLLFTEHHLSHAASAFYPSPFDEAVVLTLDGVGEWTTTSVAIGRGRELTIRKELHFPHSLGLLYSAFTYYTGFRVNSGEYKLMGLAPYGEPRFRSLILEHLIDLKPDGTFRLDMRYFNYCTGRTMTSQRFADLFGEPVRRPDDALTQFHMDVAASIQSVTEEVVLRLTRALAAEYKLPHLCLAGGVALNCVANGAVLRDGAFKDLWVQPAAGDAGGALGAALCVHHLANAHPRHKAPGARDAMKGAYLGPAFTPTEVEARLRASGARFETLPDVAMIDATAAALAHGEAVGWVQGRMEFGPRALGARSILADPRSASMQRTLNLKVKQRESFRPFAPAVLREDVDQWFDLDRDSPYMGIVAPVQSHRRIPKGDQVLFGIDRLNVPRSQIPAVTHVDYSARIQTVHRDTNPTFHALLRRFKEITGCGVLVNTSFNVRGEPIVCTPEEAFSCFMRTRLDLLVIGNCVLHKREQDVDPARFQTAFEPD
jgi:carbamoyltransferase